VQIVLSVDALRVEWFGKVSGVTLPSGFRRRINVLALADKLEAQASQSTHDARLRGIDGELPHLR
jgi:hypothetical protein